MQRMEAKGISIPYYTFQNQLMSLVRSHAQKHSIEDFIALWAGQSAGKSARGTSHQIITGLIGMIV